jgi:hypothetical protein
MISGLVGHKVQNKAIISPPPLDKDFEVMWIVMAWDG